MNRPLARRTVAALLALAGVVACTDGGPVASPSPSVSPSPAPSSPSVSASPTVSRSPSPTPSPRPAARCPAKPEGGWADQPHVTLRFRVPEDKRVVTGTEKVVFTPDLPVERLVFRLWANGPTARRGGGSSRVTSVTVDGKAATFTSAQSGTLLSVPLASRVAPGTVVVAELAFTLTLPTGVNERWGRSGSTVWFGSGFPMLAWQRGRGWATDPPTSAFAEAATSEAFQLDLTVDAPPGDVVLSTGSTPVARTGRRGAARVRDVMVAVGRFRTATDHVLGDVVTVGVAPGLPDSPADLLAKHRSAITALSNRFGPHPYTSLDVAVVPVVHGGIEFPGGIILGSRQDRDATLVHEVAHQWFYSLVGNNQARNPWLDESFATFAEAVVRGTGSRYLATSIPSAGRGRVGAPMTYWERHQSAYYRSVYVQGAAALLRARSRVGADRFDKAMRCYVNARGHAIAAPEDVRVAFAALPAVIDELRRVGALPPG